MARKRLPGVLNGATAYYRLWESTQGEEMRIDMKFVVPMVFPTTEEELRELYARPEAENDLHVIERGEVYSWLYREKIETYGPFSYSRFSLVFNGLGNETQELTLYNPAYFWIKTYDLAKKNVSQHLSRLWQRCGYRLPPTSVGFREDESI